MEVSDGTWHHLKSAVESSREQQIYVVLTHQPHLHYTIVQKYPLNMSPVTLSCLLYKTVKQKSFLEHAQVDAKKHLHGHYIGDNQAFTHGLMMTFTSSKPSSRRN